MTDLIERNKGKRQPQAIRRKANIEDFSEMMKELFMGEAVLGIDTAETQPQASEEIEDELFEILMDYDDEDEDNDNLVKISKYTKEFREKYKDTLKDIGITLEEKYNIESHGNWNFGIRPELYIEDIPRFVRILEELPKNISIETIANLEIIIESTERRITKKIIEEKQEIADDDNIANFFIECERLNKECLRLGLRKKTYNYDLVNYIIVWKERRLKEYISFKRLGFGGDLYNKETNIIPVFIGNIINKGKQKKQKGGPQEKLNRGPQEELDIREEEKKIRKSLKLLTGVIENKKIFIPLANELKRGLEDAIDTYTVYGTNIEIEKNLIEYLDTINELINLAKEIKKDDQ